MNFCSVTQRDLETFAALLPAHGIVTDLEERASFGRDETEDFCFPPEVVLFPETTAQVSAVLAYCHKQHIPVTTRGAGTGLSGGALPVYGGVCLSMKKMNHILKVDTENLQVHTQPGVITQVLQEAVSAHGLFYPPDPSSRGSCFIGGNIAENAGGPRAVKYGVTKDWVLNLEAVLADGTILETGANVLKNATGYNLTQLLVGSEGTLAVVTKAVLKLIPHPTLQWVILVPFFNAKDACVAVNAIFQAGITPSAMEFMERDALEWTLRFKPDIHMTLPADVQAHLLIEIDGFREEELMAQAEAIHQTLETFHTGEFLLATASAEKDALWKLRRSVGEAVKSNSIYKEEDTVVPRFKLPDLLETVKRIGQQYGFTSVCYGHAGDGNLHVNIIRGDLTEEDWEVTLPKAIRELFTEVRAMGGTLSGEHGIGWVQKNYMDLVFSPPHLALMQQIKHTFDPHGILNPGKIFPDSPVV
jgi:glycolate oxidase